VFWYSRSATKEMESIRESLQEKLSLLCRNLLFKMRKILQKIAKSVHIKDDGHFIRQSSPSKNSTKKRENKINYLSKSQIKRGIH